MSLKLPAATLTVIVPATFGVGVTTSVACRPSTRVKVPAVPPLTVMSLAAKLTPTSSLKTKLKVTGPLAVGAATSLAIVTVGAVVSAAAGGLPTGGGGGSASPLPQPASVAPASNNAASRLSGDRCDMGVGLRVARVGL
jgi:hypothetical protein